MVGLPHYVYVPLPPKSIRVLELQPGTEKSPLTCKIVTQPIDSDPYDAISYVWGDPTPIAAIECLGETDKSELYVAKSLDGALNALRPTDQPRRIWVDALCINQNDLAERQSQVGLMGSIYSKAKHVLCWLGPFGSDSQSITGKERASFAFDLIRKFNSSPYEHLRVAREHLHFGDDTTDTDGLLLQSWLSIKELFDLQYFHRAWIIQEVGLASRARFYWGSQDVWLDWTEVAVFCRFLDDNGASVISYLDLKSWVANHINLVWETDSSGKPVHNFVEVLHWARVHRCTDPRDYIYALLGHPSATINGSLIMQPNYSITPAEAFVGLALRVIECTNSLQILAFVDHHEEPGVIPLPTWVPDWHAVNLVAPLRCSIPGETEFKDGVFFVGCGSETVLRCRGIFIDTVRATTEMIEHSELTVTTLEKELCKNIPFLIEHIWKRTVVEADLPLASMDDLLASFSLILTGGYLNDKNSTFGEHLEQQKADLAALILEYERVRPADDSDSFIASLSPQEREKLQAVGVKGSSHQFVQDMTWTSMCRKVFRTAEGYIGLGPRIMREGDICVMLLGASYPMILRKSGIRFQLVGPVLLYRFMNGEAENLVRDGTLFEDDFDII